MRTLGIDRGESVRDVLPGARGRGRADARVLECWHNYAIVYRNGGTHGTLERILAGVREFPDGVDAGDDMTVMVLRVLEPAAKPAGS